MMGKNTTLYSYITYIKTLRIVHVYEKLIYNTHIIFVNTHVKRK